MPNSRKRGRGSPPGGARAAGIPLRNSTSVGRKSEREKRRSVSVGVIDAGVAIGWIRGGHRSAARLDALFRSSRGGHVTLYVSSVNLAEILIHTAEWSRATDSDAVALLRA